MCSRPEAVSRIRRWRIVCFPPYVCLCALSERNNLRVDLQHVAIWVAEGQRAMPKKLIGRSRNDCNAALFQRRRTCVNFLRRDPEGELQRHDPTGGEGIVKSRPRLSKSQDIGAYPILHPFRRELP